MKTKVKIAAGRILVIAVAVLVLTGLVLSTKAQDIEQLPWQQQNRKDMKPLPYEYVREADVMWSKNICVRKLFFNGIRLLDGPKTCCCPRFQPTQTRHLRICSR